MKIFFLKINKTNPLPLVHLRHCIQWTISKRTKSRTHCWPLGLVRSLLACFLLSFLLTSCWILHSLLAQLFVCCLTNSLLASPLASCVRYELGSCSMLIQFFARFFTRLHGFLFLSFFLSFFLDAPSHLYKRVCPSVCPSGRRSVTPSLRCLLGAPYAEYSTLFRRKKTN